MNGIVCNKRPSHSKNGKFGPPQISSQHKHRFIVAFTHKTIYPRDAIASDARKQRQKIFAFCPQYFKIYKIKKFAHTIKLAVYGIPFGDFLFFRGKKYSQAPVWKRFYHFVQTAATKYLKLETKKHNKLFVYFIKIMVMNKFHERFTLEPADHVKCEICEILYLFLFFISRITKQSHRIGHIHNQLTKFMLSEKSLFIKKETLHILQLIWYRSHALYLCVDVDIRARITLLNFMIMISFVLIIIIF